ncbi:MAG: hypothetical protein AB7Y46_07450 [Armatimonadota bacterium]
MQPSLDRAALVLSVLLAIGTVAVTAMACVSATDGRLVYALDDAYIHLAMGRTLAESGIWGINAQTPGAASSSPLWTLLMAGLSALLGSHEWLPLALNLLAAGVLALAADAWLRELGLTSAGRVLTVVAIILVGPLGPLAMTGMEHVAHAAAVLALALLALRERPAHPLALALMGAVATGLRYESAFVAAALAVVLGLRRDWRRAVAVVAGSAALVTAVGVWQLSMGEGFLPNSLIVKAAGVTRETALAWLKGKGYGAMERAYETPLVALPLLAVLLAYAASPRRTDMASALPSPAVLCAETAAVLALATLLHVGLSRTGWYHRYEAYLLIWGVVAVAGSLQAWRLGRAEVQRRALAGRARMPALIGLAGVGLLLLLALGLRINAYTTVATACRNIYQQHAQVARLVQRFYQDEPLVIHDIGYVGYVSRGPILDIGGLASHEVAVAKSHGWVDQGYVVRAAREHGARLAISYAHGWVPGSWVRLASWRISDNRVAGSDTVLFFALQPDAAQALLTDLRSFEADLPDGVQVRYLLSDQAGGTPRDAPTQTR